MPGRTGVNGHPGQSALWRRLRLRFAARGELMMISLGSYWPPWAWRSIATSLSAPGYKGDNLSSGQGRTPLPGLLPAFRPGDQPPGRGQSDRPPRRPPGRHQSEYSPGRSRLAADPGHPAARRRRNTSRGHSQGRPGAGRPGAAGPAISSSTLPAAGRWKEKKQRYCPRAPLVDRSGKKLQPAPASSVLLSLAKHAAAARSRLAALPRELSDAIPATGTSSSFCGREPSTTTLSGPVRDQLYSSVV